MRLYHIMNDFIANNEYLAIDFFVKKYKVSKRTIQNDISYLVYISKRNGFSLQQKRGSGYLLEIEEEERFQTFMNSLSERISFDPKDRVKNIVAYLAIQKDYITMEKIAEVFDISKSLVKKEIAEVEHELSFYDLTLEKRSHYGIRLQKNQSGLKQLLMDLYYEENKFVSNVVQETLQKDKYQGIENRILKLFDEHQFNINYHELKKLNVWLQIAIYMAQEQQVADEEKLKENDVIDGIVNDICSCMYKIYGFTFDRQRREEFAQMLRINVRTKQPVVSFSQRLETDINDFLHQIDEQYKTNFQEDVDFKNMLLTHVSLLIDRLHQKISYKNNLIDEICIKYPMIFNMAIKFSDMLKEKYDVDVTYEEAGFIATHFAVHMEKESIYKLKKYNNIAIVCSSGGGSAFLLKMKIETLFPQANVETFSLMDMEELRNFQPNLIFTIMDLKEKFDVPLIYIKELLDDQDLLRIQQVLRFGVSDEYSIAECKNPPYLSLFHRDFFTIYQKTAHSYEEVIYELAKQMEQKGIGGTHYADYVLEREHYLSTVYVNGMAIPHPIQMCGEQNLISVCILKEPLMEKEKQVKIIFLVCLKKVDYEIHKDITKRLYEIMMNEKKVGRLCECRSLEQFLVEMKEG